MATQDPELTSHTLLPPQVLAPATHLSLLSSQVSTPLQAMPSEQLRVVPAHAPAEQVSPTVQNFPSSQDAPLLLLQAAGLALSHFRHGLVGLLWPSP